MQLIQVPTVTPISMIIKAPAGAISSARTAELYSTL